MSKNESVEQIKKQLREMQKSLREIEESIDHFNGTASKINSDEISSSPTSTMDKIVSTFQTIGNVINGTRELVIGAKQVFDCNISGFGQIKSGFGKIVAESDNIEQLTYQISIGFNEQAEGKEDSWDQIDKMQLQPITTQEGIHKHKTQTQLESVIAESNKGLQGLMKS